MFPISLFCYLWRLTRSRDRERERRRKNRWISHFYEINAQSEKNSIICIAASTSNCFCQRRHFVVDFLMIECGIYKVVRRSATNQLHIMCNARRDFYFRNVAVLLGKCVKYSCSCGRIACAKQTNGSNRSSSSRLLLCNSTLIFSILLCYSSIVFIFWWWTN